MFNPKDPIEKISRHLAVSAEYSASHEELADALSGRHTTSAARHDLQTYLNEADPTQIIDLIGSKETTLATLKLLAGELLPPEHPNRTFLDSCT
jgi:hypothetical protein